MSALSKIDSFLDGTLTVLKTERWLMYLALTNEIHQNFEQLDTLKDISSKQVLQYVIRTLTILKKSGCSADTQKLLEQVLMWSEVAKCGMVHQRKEWLAAGYNLDVHNIGSAQIYDSQCLDPNRPNSKERHIISVLIRTHGLVGQYLRGEVPLQFNKPLHDLITEDYLTKENLLEIMMTLNQCVIEGVSETLWHQLSEQVTLVCQQIVEGNFNSEYSPKERFCHLRKLSNDNGDDFELSYQAIESELKSKASELKSTPIDLSELLETLMDQKIFWYLEAALYDFSLQEVVKILCLTKLATNDGSEDTIIGNHELIQGSEKSSTSYKAVEHISFEPLMQQLYYQRDNHKQVNIYKKRIIEKYLKEMELPLIHKDSMHLSEHVKLVSHFRGLNQNTLTVSFEFSPAAEKLIAFCMEAEKAGVLFEQAIILLYDLFNFRKDPYDRFYEEEKYLATMNQSVDSKKIILDYIVGETIVDIGPGGGALMDLILARYPEKKVVGVDIAQNVIDTLNKRKYKENKAWDVAYGNALSLGDTFDKGQVDTVIFCSILHELFSYIEFEGKKFNHETLKKALKETFDILPVGGRIIIRDGIMTEPESENRLLTFHSEEGFRFLERYQKDFKGREIQVRKLNQHQVLMPVNDAMEFLYTYTWGEASYVHEVNEQFGYLTPTGFKEMIQDLFGSSATIITLQHYLQEGYALALSPKVSLYNNENEPVALPDSTCIVVIEKTS